MILFLDFDGVLHSGPCKDAQMFCHVPLFEEVMREFPTVRIVISSSWAKHYAWDELTSPFSEGIRNRVLGHTPSHKSIILRPALKYALRAVEIAAWLIINGEISESWNALDDRPNWILLNETNLIRCETAMGFDEMARLKPRKHIAELLANP
jgi:hypothetical protein